MQTRFTDETRALPRADEAERILRSCVHCGFCNATCPTHRLLGDELDGPRGRIYLIKQVLEGGEPGPATQLHLDRCLSCRNCETTCPSGVNYHALLDIGRPLVEARVRRPWPQRLFRFVLRALLPRRRLFALLLGAGRALRPVLPAPLKARVPPRPAPAGALPAGAHARRVLLPAGCVQPSLTPATRAAAARVLDRFGIALVETPAEGCCGAVDYHLNAQQRGLQRARRNIDAWWPAVEAGAEAIVQTASGCGAFVREYGHLLRDDPDYAERAAHVSALARDLVEVLADEPLESAGVHGGRRVAFHCPCTLQHAQGLGGATEAVLRRLGFELTAVRDPHLCCGSAGTYSITQPSLARQLRDDRLDALEVGAPEVIATANVGCQVHLDGGGRTPVRHWIELVDAALAPQRPGGAEARS